MLNISETKRVSNREPIGKCLCGASIGDVIDHVTWLYKVNARRRSLRRRKAGRVPAVLLLRNIMKLALDRPWNRQTMQRAGDRQASPCVPPVITGIVHVGESHYMHGMWGQYFWFCIFRRLPCFWWYGCCTVLYILSILRFEVANARNDKIPKFMHTVQIF